MDSTTSCPPSLRAFFDTHAAATAQCKRDAHDQLQPIMTMCDAVVAHVSDLQSKLTAAELAAHDHGLDPKLEWMHTRLSAAMDRVAAFRAAGRELARVLVEVEKSFDQDQIDVATMLARIPIGVGPLDVSGETVEKAIA